MESNDVFWVVWNEGGGPPTHRHKYRPDAEREAQRLAIVNPGKRFYVLMAESFVERNDVRRVILEHPNPF